MIKITSNIDQVAKELARLAEPQRMSKALSTALTRAAKAAQHGIQAEIPKVFDRPTPYTMNSIAVEPSTVQTLQARVFVKNKSNKGAAPDVRLGPMVFTGKRGHRGFELALQRAGVLPAGMYAVPAISGAAQVDQYGNWSRSQMMMLLKYFQAAGGKNLTRQQRLNRVRGNAARNNYGAMYWAGRPGGKGHLGIYRVIKTGFGRDIQPVAFFVSSARYRKQFQFHETAQRIAARELPVQVKRAVDEALARLAKR